MLSPRDPEYAEARLYKLGKRRMVPPFSTLAEWIEEQYGIAPLQVRLDVPDAGALQKYRLDVVLDREGEQARFRSVDRLNYDQAKQAAIGEQFLALAREADHSGSVLGKLLPFSKARVSMPKDIEDLFVVFSAFEKVAREEANIAVADVECEELAKVLGLWKTHRQFGAVTFMFETDREVELAEKDGRAEVCRTRYAELLKPHDAFGYFADRPIWSKCDSRETFERDYQGNWFCYTR